MTSHPDFEDGDRAGRDARDGPPTLRRSSNAFGSPGSDSTVRRVDLNEAFIRHPDATFVMRAAGHAMQDAGIANGDVLLVDRAIAATNGTVVIAAVAGELVCRRLELPSKERPAAPPRLLAADGATAAIVITQETPLEVWGVVTTVIKSLAA
jgi:DNA polymerase V